MIRIRQRGRMDKVRQNRKGREKGQKKREGRD